MRSIGGLQPGGDGVAALERGPAEKQVEHRGLLVPAQRVVAAGHGELVQIGEQGEVHGGAGVGGGGKWGGAVGRSGRPGGPGEC